MHGLLQKGMIDARHQETIFLPLGENDSAIDHILSAGIYVPQSLVAAYKPGRKVAIACDGCAGGMTATVNFVASEPEFTPPVIYSLATRDKLVFLVEAVPANPQALVVGQPISVSAIDHSAAGK